MEPLVCLQQVLTLCPPWPQKLQPQGWSWKRWKLERFHMEKILHWLVPCLLVQNVAWSQYVLFYFWVFDGTECCLESVCIILLLSVWWYRMLPGISMYYFTFECLMVQNVAWNQYVICIILLLTHPCLMVQNVAWNRYVLFYFWVFDGTACCLESVCIIVLLTVSWYRMLPGISMYYCTFDCLLVQNVAWNQYVLFYFWVFDGT